MKHRTIIIVDSVNAIRQRIKHVLESNQFTVLEASSSKEFFSIYNSRQTDIDSIVLDVEIKELDGFSIIKELRAAGDYTPVIFLTSDSKRSMIVKAIVSGAADIIIKPFDDAIILQKVSLIHAKLNFAPTRMTSNGLEIFDEPSNTTQSNQALVSFDILSLVEKEFIKANKGNYNITLQMSTFFKPSETITAATDEAYYVLSPAVFKVLQNNIWETDYFIQYGSQTFIGLFPFCNEENSAIIKDKMNVAYEQLQKMDERFADHYLVHMFLSFPTQVDGANGFDMIINHATTLLKSEIEKIRDTIIIPKE